MENGRAAKFEASVFHSSALLIVAACQDTLALLVLTCAASRSAKKEWKMMLKVVIAGSREFRDYAKMKKLVVEFLSDVTDEIEVVSGGCRGADMLGEWLANEKGWAVKRFEADWKLYGKSVGVIRNREMARYADICLLFMVKGAENRGSKNMLKEARRFGCKVYVAR